MSRIKLALAAAALFTGALAAPAHSQTALPGPSVFDATGRYVGNLLEQNKLLIKYADGEAVLIVSDQGVAEGGTQNASDVFILYTTTDCTGQAFATVRSSPMVGHFDKSATPPAAGYAAGGTVYYARRPYQTIAARSQSSGDLSPFRSCSQLNVGTWLVGAVGSQPLPALKLPLVVK